MREEKILPISILNEYNLGSEITSLINTSYYGGGVNFYYIDHFQNHVHVKDLKIPPNTKSFYFEVGDEETDPITYNNYQLKVIIQPKEFSSTPILENWGTFLYIGDSIQNDEIVFTEKEDVENIDLYIDNSQESITLKEPPVVTDLSNTCWVLKNNTLPLGNIFNINFYANGTEYHKIRVGNSISYDDIILGSSNRDKLKTIIIKNGEDTKNSELINWITRNAAQCEVKILIEGDVSYETTTLANSINQLKTYLLKDQGQLVHAFELFRWGNGERIWYFNKNRMSMPRNAGDTCEFEINFQSNEVNFSKIRISRYLDYDIVASIKYIDENDNETLVYNIGSGWSRVAFSTILILSEIYSNDFTEWLTNNAVEKSTDAARQISIIHSSAKSTLHFDPYATFIKILTLQENIESENNN